MSRLFQNCPAYIETYPARVFWFEDTSIVDSNEGSKTSNATPKDYWKRANKPNPGNKENYGEAKIEEIKNYTCKLLNFKIKKSKLFILKFPSIYSCPANPMGFLIHI